MEQKQNNTILIIFNYSTKNWYVIRLIGTLT